MLIDESRAFRAPTDAERDAYHVAHQQDIQAQRERALEQQKAQRAKIEAQLSRGGDAALEKRRARLAKKGAAGEPAASPAPADESVDHLPYVHYTPGPPSGTPGFVPCTLEMADGEHARVNTYLTLQAAYGAGVWTYPATLEERARCAVFEDLHAKGFFLSTGLRFGGDFVVYPGDPLRYHSHYTAAVLSVPEDTMAAFHVVAAGRLGTAVKKSHLLCQAHTRIRSDEEARRRREQGADDAGEPWGDVEYWSLAWAGFGT